MLIIIGPIDLSNLYNAIVYICLLVQVRKCFRPELLNRLSEIVVFEPLSHHQLKKVVNIQMKNVIARLASKGISLVPSDDVLDVIVSESYNPVSTTSFSAHRPHLLE
jgi:ATP-dependent Clp protease ATP-binding subunit ClpA